MESLFMYMIFFVFAWSIPLLMFAEFRISSFLHLGVDSY